jgi:hypothetical protein
MGTTIADIKNMARFTPDMPVQIEAVELGRIVSHYEGAARDAFEAGRSYGWRRGLWTGCAMCLVISLSMTTAFEYWRAVQ